MAPVERPLWVVLELTPDEEPEAEEVAAGNGSTLDVAENRAVDDAIAEVIAAAEVVAGVEMGVGVGVGVDEVVD